MHLRACSSLVGDHVINLGCVISPSPTIRLLIKGQKVTASDIIPASRSHAEPEAAAGVRATPTLIEGGQCPAPPPTLVQCYRVLPLLVGPV